MALKPITEQLIRQPHTVEGFEAFLALPENRGRLFELVEGEIVEKMPTEEHGVTAAWIVTFINMFLLSNPKRNLARLDGSFFQWISVKLATSAWT